MISSHPSTTICRPFSYALTPAGYKCTDCGAINCKLWRQSHTVASSIELQCAVCACKSQDQAITTMDDAGTIESDMFERGGKVTIGETGEVKYFGINHPMPRTDQIGNMLPAIPTEEGDTYWGYTSAPEAGCVWWRSLPSLKASCRG